MAFKRTAWQKVHTIRDVSRVLFARSTSGTHDTNAKGKMSKGGMEARINAADPKAAVAFATQGTLVMGNLLRRILAATRSRSFLGHLTSSRKRVMERLAFMRITDRRYFSR